MLMHSDKALLYIDSNSLDMLHFFVEVITKYSDRLNPSEVSQDCLKKSGLDAHGLQDRYKHPPGQASGLLGVGCLGEFHTDHYACCTRTKKNKKPHKPSYGTYR